MWRGSTSSWIVTGCCHGLIALTVASAAAAEPPQTGDLRIVLVEQQIDGRTTQALATVEKALAEDPATARSLGLEYLQGHLLLRLGRRQEALEAFAATMGSTPVLGAFGRYRLAVEQEELGHPEISAGLTATLLGSNPPVALVLPAMQLLQRTLARGGDCRVLGGLDRMRWSRQARRWLSLTVADCAARGGAAADAERLYLKLLEEEHGDGVARYAAENVTASQPDKRDARTHLLIGLTYHAHREFRRAIHHLARALVQLPAAGVNTRETFDCRYALARSHFWLGRYEPAAAAFGALATATSSPADRAQVLYQQGRCLELLGDFEHAAAVFQRAYETDPRNRRWADAALISNLRLRWLLGDEDGAFATYRKLVVHRKFSTATRALFFLASSELSRGGSEQAGGWLASIDQLGKAVHQELRYWQGRLEENRSRPAAAAEHYVAALVEDPYHPFGVAARRRLEQARLKPSARRLGRHLAFSQRPDELYAAWLLLGSSDPRAARVWEALQARLRADAAVLPYLELTPAPVASWPLWRRPLERPDDMLLALGIFDEGSSAVLRHFPVAEPDLAFTGGLVLVRSGETRQALYIAEILAKRVPRGIPSQVLTVDYQRLLFPLAYRPLIDREAAARGVDPFLLAAIIREESRFDPRAFSSASARGLTQFVYPTARRIAAKIGLGPISSRDLERPETAIALGAAYLAELSQEFGGAVPRVVAAYNAGEPQAGLWQRYCYGNEPEEFLTKVSFSQTRAYVAKVMTSREHYAELYSPVVVSGD
ncbi:MAG: transglycosylase SLT domain-containing protein [Thermoanaerobaculia bacterium]